MILRGEVWENYFLNESGVSPECNGALTDATERFLRTAAKALDLEIGDVSLRSVQNIEKS